MEIQENEVFHPRIINSCLPLFYDGHYQHAALESMKQVEMALREKGIAPKDRFGDRLVNWVLGSGEHITLSLPLGDDLQEKNVLSNGSRKRRLGGTRLRHFNGTSCEPRNLPENAATPRLPLHALLDRTP